MSAETIWQFKDMRINGAGEALTSVQRTLWFAEGVPADGATPPTTYRNPDNTTVGGILQASPPSGKSKILTALAVCPQRGSGNLILLDRLLDISGLVANITTTQNINGGSDATISRYTSGLGNSIWIEIYTAIGATQHTLTVNYKNEASASKSTTVQIGGAAGQNIYQMLRVPLAAGDKGVTALVSCALDVSTGTAGNFGLIVAHRLLSFAIGIGQPQLYVGAQRGMVDVTGAALMWSDVVTTAPVASNSHFEAIFTMVDK